MRYVYHATREGTITDLRFAPQDYKLREGEREGEADRLPDPRRIPEYKPEANPGIEAVAHLFEEKPK